MNEQPPLFPDNEPDPDKKPDKEFPFGTEDVFDDKLGEQLKTDGMNLAAENREALLEQAKAAAVEIAISRPNRRCCADDVYCFLVNAGVDVSQLGNAAGSLFKKERWEFTGDRVRSKRITNHARWIMVWRLK
jgi:hypothetical protein